MVHQLKLQNVIRHSPDANPNSPGPKYYSTEYKTPAGNIGKLTMNNSKYLDVDCLKNNILKTAALEAGDKIFDFRLDCIRENTNQRKTIFDVKGLKTKGEVEYDEASHIVTVGMPDTQPKYVNLPVDYAEYIEGMNSFMMGDNLDEFMNTIGWE